MTLDTFVASRRERWERLETLLGRVVSNGPANLSAAEFLELGALYRSATSDLAVARRDFPTDKVTVYLNGILARTHPVVYRDRRMTVAGVGRYVRYGFPAAYRAVGRYTVLAFGLFALSALVAFVLVSLDDSLADVLLPGTAQPLRNVMEQHHLWMNAPGESSSIVANFIMVNNIQVAFLAFAGGVLLGTLSAYVLISNGIMLGAIAAMVGSRGLAAPFWSFIVPHGVIELSVIFMAGGAGLSIGDALLRPGFRPRRDSFAQASSLAVRVLFGCVPLLIVAGSIEGFLSPSSAPVPLKLALGVTSGLLLYSYLLFSRPHVRVAEYRFEDLVPANGTPQRRVLPLTSR